MLLLYDDSTFETHSNLVNSKSSRLEVLFRIINSWNYREVDIKYITKKMRLLSGYVLWARKRNDSMKRFFKASKTYAIIDS